MIGRQLPRERSVGRGPQQTPARGYSRPVSITVSCVTPSGRAPKPTLRSPPNSARFAVTMTAVAPPCGHDDFSRFELASLFKDDVDRQTRLGDFQPIGVGRAALLQMIDDVADILAIFGNGEANVAIGPAGVVVRRSQLLAAGFANSQDRVERRTNLAGNEIHVPDFALLRREAETIESAPPFR